MRSLVLSDPGLASVDDAWTLGRDVLAAPVLRPGATSAECRCPRATAGSPCVLRLTRDTPSCGVRR